MKKKLIIGFDLSSAKVAGVAIPVEDDGNTAWINHKQQAHLVNHKMTVPYIANNCLTAYDLVSNWLINLRDLDYEFSQIAVEHPVYGTNQRSTIVQSMVNGAVQVAILRWSGVQPLMVHNTEWKKAVVDNGAASKALVMEYMRDYHPWLYEAAQVEMRGGRWKTDQDVLDAGAVALWAIQFHARSLRSSDGG